MKQIKAGTVISCEYIALGSHGKHTLVNVYTGPDLVVQQFPAAIPLAFYIEIIPDRSLGNAMKVQIFHNKKIRFEAAAEFEFEEGRTGLAVLPQMRWSFDKETNVRVVISCEGFKPTTVFTKRIRLGDVPAN